MRKRLIRSTRTRTRPGLVGPFDRFVDAHRIEEVRSAVRRELATHQGTRMLSAEIGVSRGVLRKLVEMRSVPEPENLCAIQSWADDRPPSPTPVEATCLAILAAGLPPDERVDSRRALARALRDAYARAGSECPPWLGNELASAR